MRLVIQFKARNSYLFFSHGQPAVLLRPSQYSKVSNRQGVWNSRGDWKKYPKLIVVCLCFREIVFSSPPRANFSSFEYLCFSFLLVFRIILIQYIRVKTEKQSNYLKIEKTQSRPLVIQLETNYNPMSSEIRTKDNLRRNVLGGNIKRIFCYCRDLKMFQLEHFPKFNKRWVWN